MSVGILNTENQPESFAFTDQNLAEAKRIIAKYPEGRQQSAVLPLLQMAQRQHDNWLPRAAMDVVAEMLEMPKIRVYEVATFYSMFNLQPVGENFVQVCTTTPCWLAGSDDIVKVCKRRMGKTERSISADGKFTWMEVECLGACVNAPMVQINDDYYEDLTPEIFESIVDALDKGDTPAPGSQSGRRGSMAQRGPTSLADKARAAGIKMAKE